MDGVTYLDTHVLVWLRGGRIDLLGPKAAGLIRENQLLISPIVVLELQYLLETDKIAEPANDLVAALSNRCGLQVCTLGFGDVIAESLKIQWTRDPFDRIIAAQAMLADAPLVTKDRTIRGNCPRAVWD